VGKLGGIKMSRIEDEVCKKIGQRAEVGKSKYGVTMETAPLSQLEWLIHAQEEAMDLAVYLQKLIEMVENTKPTNRQTTLLEFFPDLLQGLVE
tara:strand:- start:14 stop:292 length:279 start_codon:yes stop_codon:yes gene_type:complete